MDDFKMPSSNRGRDVAKSLMSNSVGAPPTTQDSTPNSTAGTYQNFKKGGKVAPKINLPKITKASKKKTAVSPVMDTDMDGMKKGGKASKKCYARGGKVQKTMGDKIKSGKTNPTDADAKPTVGQQTKPKAVTGFKKGGKAKRCAAGGAAKVRHSIMSESGKINPKAR